MQTCPKVSFSSSPILQLESTFRNIPTTYTSSACRDTITGPLSFLPAAIVTIIVLIKNRSNNQGAKRTWMNKQKPERTNVFQWGLEWVRHSSRRWRFHQRRSTASFPHLSTQLLHFLSMAVTPRTSFLFPTFRLFPNSQNFWVLSFKLIAS